MERGAQGVNGALAGIEMGLLDTLTKPVHRIDARAVFQA
jgi:hypothetical protein